MSKNPAERYGTAQEMADDLRRWLDDRPIRARRPSWGKAAARWARRHRPMVVSAAAVLLALLLLGGANLWWAERQEAETERAVGEHLQRATVYQEEGRWQEAQRELVRAEERLAGGGPPTLTERVRTLQMDAALAADLDAADLGDGATLQLAGNGPGFGVDFAGADQAYAAAFRQRGLDLAALPPGEAAARVRRSTISARLVVVLDHWAYIKEALGGGDGERLLAVARLADDNPWRQQLRDPAVRKDKDVPERLAQEDNVLDQPATNLVLLADLLCRLPKGQAAAQSLLRRAQQRYPDDFWILTDLAIDLDRDPPPQSFKSASDIAAWLGECASYCRAAPRCGPSVRSPTTTSASS